MTVALFKGLREDLPQRPASAVQSATGRPVARRLVINGRFLTQPETGVQRYARQIVLHLDGLLGKDQASLIVPRAPTAPIALTNIEMHRSRVSGGALWEQAVLPAWFGHPTVNLCNTAPLLSRRAIVCIHDCNVFEAADTYSLAFRSYYRRLLPLLVRNSAHIVTVSHHSAHMIRRHLGVPLHQINVLPNGFEHALSWDAAKSTLRPLLDADTRPFILLLGSLARQKNAALVLGLSDRLKSFGIRIKVVGAGSSIFTRTSFDRDDNVDWLGRVRDDDLALLMERALCLAFPSKNEGFGLPVLEAMARGCPVVASDRSSLPEVCGDAAMLADPDDPGAWLDRFTALFKSAQLRRDLSGKGLERCRLFSWHASAKGYFDMVGRHD